MTTQQSFALAVQHHQAGRLGDAEALYRQILAVEPQHAGALQYLGVIAHQLGCHDLAVERILQALVLDPNSPGAHSNLGEAYRMMGRLDEAVASLRRAIQLQPDLPEAHDNLGIALAGLGRHDEAIAAYHRALQLRPDFPEAHNNLGVALAEQGLLDEAVAAYYRALQLRPNYPEAHMNLGNRLRERGQLDGARAAYHRALELKPDYAEAHINLGNAFKDQGQLDEAVAAYRRATQLKPEEPGLHGNLIYALHFHPGHDGSVIAEEHQRWNRRFSDPFKPLFRPHANDRSPDRRLRIGYVSPEFRDHVTGRYLVPLFQCHDHRDFEILCYAGVVKPDSLTETFRQHADQWRSTVGVTDEALAAMIRQDGVDILVDLTQHLAGNRLPMFALQPAPVQVSVAGYPETTGLEAIGYRISDRYLEGDLQSNIKHQT